MPDQLDVLKFVAVRLEAAGIAARRMFNLVHREALQKVDIIVRDDREYEIEKFHRRRQIERWAMRLTVTRLLADCHS